MGKIRIAILVLLFTVAALVEAGRLTALSAISGADVWWCAMNAPCRSFRNTHWVGAYRASKVAMVLDPILMFGLSRGAIWTAAMKLPRCG